MRPDNAVKSDVQHLLGNPIGRPLVWRYAHNRGYLGGDAAAFGDLAAVDTQGIARVPGGALVYRITRREPFDPVAFESARPALSQEVESNRKSALRESILTKLRDRYPVEINQTLVGQIDGVR